MDLIPTAACDIWY